MITSENWPLDWAHLPAWTEVSKEVYEHFFNAMPLLEWTGGYFQPVEPYTHDLDDKGRRRCKYMTFTKKDGKFWYLGVQFRGDYPKESE